MRARDISRRHVRLRTVSRDRIESHPSPASSAFATPIVNSDFERFLGGYLIAEHRGLE